MKKFYQVFYWVKANRHEYLRHMFVIANTSKEACQICKLQVFVKTGCNAFRPTTRTPDPKELEKLRKLSYYVVD